MNDMETCVSLRKELQEIWDEVGELEIDRDKILFDLEQECLEAYRRRVNQARHIRAQLKQAVANSEAELAHIGSLLGEGYLPMKQSEPTSLKKELAVILRQLEMMQKKKNVRKIQFKEIIHQIHNISKELCPSTREKSWIDESDLSLRRLEDIKRELLALEKEKSDRLKQVLDQLKTLHSVCSVLGMEFKSLISGIHPALDNPGSNRNISADTIEKLSNAVSRLNEIKLQRLHRVQDLATTIMELWNLLDISIEEQQPFQNVTSYIGASENEVTERNALSLVSIESTEIEISRLQELKSIKIIEVLMKKKADLVQLYRQARMPVVMQGAIDFSRETLESGAIDTSFLLEQVALHISNLKEEAFSRREILEKIDKWLAACEEETWLEEYNMDDNRYNAGKGSHLLLKHAERARVLVQRIPAMVETLREKARAWEQERGVEFSYDGVTLLSVLNDYDNQKHKKDQDRQRRRDQKKLQAQLILEQELRFGSKPSPLKSGRKLVKAPSVGSNDRRGSAARALTKIYKSNQIPFAENVTSPHNRYHSSGCAKSYAGTTNVGSSNLSFRKYYVATEHQNQTRPYRKPLSPVNASFLANANINFTNDPNKTPQKTPPPSGEDNMKTPKTLTSTMPSTPATMLMKMTQTPSTPFVHCGADGVEYSYEEIRAGEFLVKT